MLAFGCILGGKFGIAALGDRAEPGESISALPPTSEAEVRVVAPDSTPKRVIYACGLVAVASILFLMIYSGMFEGFGDAVFDIAKEIVKFFIG